MFVLDPWFPIDWMMLAALEWVASTVLLTPMKTLFSERMLQLTPTSMHALSPVAVYRLLKICTFPKRTRGMRWLTLSAHQSWCQVTLRCPASVVTVSADPIRFENRCPLAPATGSVRRLE